MNPKIMMFYLYFIYDQIMIEGMDEIEISITVNPREFAILGNAVTMAREDSPEYASLQGKIDEAI